MPEIFNFRWTYKHAFLAIFFVYALLMLFWFWYLHYSENQEQNNPHSQLFILKGSASQKKNSQITHNSDYVDQLNPFPSQISTMYSVGCGSLMMWQLTQSIVLEYSWYNVKQHGHVIRLVSGCDQESLKLSKMEDKYKSQIDWMSKTPLNYKADIHHITLQDIKNVITGDDKFDDNNNNNNNHNNDKTIRIDLDMTTPVHIIFVPSYQVSKELIESVKSDDGNIGNDGFDVGDGVPNYGRFSYFYEFSKLKYPQLNRIFALWLLFCNADNGIEFIHNFEKYNIPYIMMIDPDFIFLNQVSMNKDNDLKNGLGLHKPVSQDYGLGNRWFNWYKDYYTDEKYLKQRLIHNNNNNNNNDNNKEGRSIFRQDITSMSNSDSSKYYESGVPYIMHYIDWISIIPNWVEYMGIAYEKHNGGIESDMYAFVMSLFHNNLKFTILNNFMSTCMKSNQQNIHPFLKNKQYFIHYCQRYWIDSIKIDKNKDKNDHDDENIINIDKALKARHPNYGKTDNEEIVVYNFTFNKHWTKARYKQKWFIECESPILMEQRHFDDDVVKEKFSPQQTKHYLLINEIVPTWNNAITIFKEKYCSNKTINLKKSITLHEATLKNGDILFHEFDSIL